MYRKDFKWLLKLREKMGVPHVYHRSLDHQQLIFIHIPKCAGSSLGTALAGTDIIGHYPWEVYRNYDAKKFENHLKFAVLRDPIERFISAYSFLLNGGKGGVDMRSQDIIRAKSTDINEFVQKHFDKKLMFDIIHFVPQHNFVTDYENKLMVDLLFPLNKMERGIEILKKELGRDLSIDHVNKTSGKKIVLEEASIEKLKELYDIDIELYKSVSNEIHFNRH